MGGGLLGRQGSAAQTGGPSRCGRASRRRVVLWPRKKKETRAQSSKGNAKPRLGMLVYYYFFVKATRNVAQARLATALQVLRAPRNLEALLLQEKKFSTGRSFFSGYPLVGSRCRRRWNCPIGQAKKDDRAAAGFGRSRPTARVTRATTRRRKKGWARRRAVARVPERAPNQGFQWAGVDKNREKMAKGKQIERPGHKGGRARHATPSLSSAEERQGLAFVVHARRVWHLGAAAPKRHDPRTARKSPRHAPPRSAHVAPFRTHKEKKRRKK